MGLETVHKFSKLLHVSALEAPFSGSLKYEVEAPVHQCRNTVCWCLWSFVFETPREWRLDAETCSSFENLCTVCKHMSVCWYIWLKGWNIRSLNDDRTSGNKLLQRQLHFVVFFFPSISVPLLALFVHPLICRLISLHCEMFVYIAWTDNTLSLAENKSYHVMRWPALTQERQSEEMLHIHLDVSSCVYDCMRLCFSVVTSL
jgi:hypothetical protein